MDRKLKLEIEELEERIAPQVAGLVLQAINGASGDVPPNTAFGPAVASNAATPGAVGAAARGAAT